VSERADAAVAALRAQAERVAWRYEGRERDAVWIAGRLATEHARQHLESIVATVARP
jgi:hypothetical protein